VEEIQTEALNLCHTLLLYGEGPLKDPSNGALCVSRMLGPLQSLLHLLGRCEQVLVAALNQLAALSASTEVRGSILFSSSTPDIYFQPLVDCIAELLLTLITVQVKKINNLIKFKETNHVFCKYK